jgi:hypothetical protein
MNVAVSVRISTNRQHQPQTLEQPLERLWAHISAHPGWHLADAPIDRDEDYSDTSLNRPRLDQLRDHAAFAAFERVLITRGPRDPAKPTGTGPAAPATGGAGATELDLMRLTRHITAFWQRLQRTLAPLQ